MDMLRAFIELDEAYSDRQLSIDTLKKAGKNYNFDKYTDTQLYRMAQRVTQPKVAVKAPAHELDLDFEPRKIERCEFCNTQLTDLGQCPKCELGEEDLKEWKTYSGQSTGTTVTATSVSQSTATQQTPQPHLPSGKYAVRIVSHGGRLRALATDGVHPAAWVAFPNDLRQFDGQQYEVDQLIWNGKNYRVAGNIVEI